MIDGFLISEPERGGKLIIRGQSVLIGTSESPPATTKLMMLFRDKKWNLWKATHLELTDWPFFYVLQMPPRLSAPSRCPVNRINWTACSSDKSIRVNTGIVDCCGRYGPIEYCLWADSLKGLDQQPKTTTTTTMDKFKWGETVNEWRRGGNGNKCIDLLGGCTTRPKRYQHAIRCRKLGNHFHFFYYRAIILYNPSNHHCHRRRSVDWPAETAHGTCASQATEQWLCNGVPGQRDRRPTFLSQC